MNAIIGTISDALYFRDPHKRVYFLIGIIAFLGLIVGAVAGFKLRSTLSSEARFVYSVVTGLTLLGCILYQWMLFFARLTRRAAACRTHYKIHRWVGSATIVIFAIHAGGFGYALVTLMAVAFVIVAVSGLFNKEVLILRRRWLKHLWDFAHIGLSGILLPLIALHIWAALAFK